MTGRKSFSRRERGRLFLLNQGVCYLCEGRIGIGEAYDIEHVIPWEISRDDSDGNLKLAHVRCHRVKTSDDRKDIAKVQRIEAKHNGTWPKTRSPLKSAGFPSTRLWRPLTDGAEHDRD